MLNVQCQEISYSYDGNKVLDNITLNAEAGDFVCLLGPSGCGKSTLLRLMAGLILPDSGSVAVNGKNVTGPGLDRGVVFQDYSLFPWLSARNNIVIALEQAFPELNKNKYRSIADEYLELVGLGNAGDKLPKQMSGGMQQRVAIARAFAINSPVLLMDEPFGALDAITRAKLQQLLSDLWDQNADNRKTVFFVTHDTDEAILLATHIAVMGVNPGNIKFFTKVTVPKFSDREKTISSSEFQKLRNQLLSVLHGNVFESLERSHLVNDLGAMI